MNVLDHEPHTWFLLRDADSLLLDTNCSLSMVDYSFLIELSSEEIREYGQTGRSYLTWLAQQIQNSAPILIASQSIFKDRDLSSSHGARVIAAIKTWRSGSASSASNNSSKPTSPCRVD